MTAPDDFGESLVSRAAALWGQGLCTLSIATELRVPEHEIYNRIGAIKIEAQRRAA